MWRALCWVNTWNQAGMAITKFSYLRIACLHKIGHSQNTHCCVICYLAAVPFLAILLVYCDMSAMFLMFHVKICSKITKNGKKNVPLWQYLIGKKKKIIKDVYSKIGSLQQHCQCNLHSVTNCDLTHFVTRNTQNQVCIARGVYICVLV